MLMASPRLFWGNEQNLIQMRRQSRCNASSPEVLLRNMLCCQKEMRELRRGAIRLLDEEVSSLFDCCIMALKTWLDICGQEAPGITRSVCQTSVRMVLSVPSYRRFAKWETSGGTLWIFVHWACLAFTAFPQSIAIQEWESTKYLTVLLREKFDLADCTPSVLQDGPDTERDREQEITPNPRPLGSNAADEPESCAVRTEENNETHATEEVNLQIYKVLHKCSCHLNIYIYTPCTTANRYMTAANAVLGTI